MTTSVVGAADTFSHTIRQLVSALYQTATILVIAAWLFPNPALAQTVPAEPAESVAGFEELIKNAREGGSTVIIVQDPSETSATTDTAESGASSTQALNENVLRARQNLILIFSELPDFPSRVVTAIKEHSPRQLVTWPLITVFFTIVFLAVGWGAKWLFQRWARPYFAYLFNPEPQSRAEKISYVLFRGFMQSVGVALQCLVAVLLVYMFDEGASHLRTTALIVIAGVGTVYLSSVFFQNLFVPFESSHRILNLSDDDASRLHREIVGLIGVMTVAFCLCLWMDALQLHFKAHTLSLVLAIGLSALLIGVYAVANRRVIGAMILGAGEEVSKPAALRVLARIWHIPVLIYVVAAFATTTIRLLIGAPNAMGLVVAPVLLIFAALALNGVALLVIEWAFTRRRAHAIAAGAEGLEENLDAAGPSQGLQDLAEHAAGLIIIAGTFWLIAKGWGVNIAEPGSILHNVWEIILIGFLAYLAYEAVKVTIDRKIAEETGEEAEVELGAEGGGQGSSRLGTLLPIFRNFLVILIFSIGVMIGLSELGVDIGPLFAGAGIVGVAIGFGSQTLVRDIFSGAFFLVDDAFRKGEYIEIAGTRGTVEKISVRSMQLRHHKGPLHTIPFGEITQLTNFSRDWVIMKLPLRLTYDTDVEMVRKLIKNLGQELLEHPEIGSLFLEPLKSQGVYQMEDSAMIIRVKFMTKPGDQFSVRKVVYSRIRELFEENGIRFASREVTVRVADTSEPEKLTEEERKAITGSVRPLLD